MISIDDFKDCNPKVLLLSQYNKSGNINIRAFAIIDLKYNELSYSMEMRDDNGIFDGDFVYKNFYEVIHAVNYWLGE